MKRIAIICVMRTGGSYSMNDVGRLYKMLCKHTTIPFNFVCLTNTHSCDNMRKPFRIIPLKNEYKGWWAKIELFRSDLVLNERILYFDLDTVILQNIDDLLLRKESFIGLFPFNKKKDKIKNFIASGIMGWINDGSLSFIYDEFDYEKDSFTYKGDQNYINEKVQERHILVTFWQDVVDGIFSFKRHIRTGEVSKLCSRIVCFHGNPRPKDVVL